MVRGDYETAMKKTEVNSAPCSLWEGQETTLNCKGRFRLWKILSLNRQAASSPNPNLSFC